MSSRHSMNRVPLAHHKQHTITREKKEQSKYDVKLSVGVQTHSRHSSARNSNLTETLKRSDELQQNLENDKRLILQLSTDVKHTNEECKRLCHELGKREVWHRISGLPMMVNDVKSKITDLERTVSYYTEECSNLKEENGKVKKRIMQLQGKCVLLASKQKLGKEQVNAPKNLMNRQKAQGAHVTMRPTSRYRATNLDRIKAEKLEIDKQLQQYQSDLDSLIKAERRLREIINGLQDSHAIVKNDSQKLTAAKCDRNINGLHDSHATVKNDSQKLKLTAVKCDRKHKREKEVVQRTVTKQAHHNSQADVFCLPSQSSDNLHAIADKASNQVTVEAYRAKLEVAECELKNCKAARENLERRIGELLNEPSKLNDKFQEQLVQTSQQLEDEWMNTTKEKDKRIAELEKQISNMDETINHQRQHQTELKLRLKETSTKLELQNHELIGVNRLVESMRADLAQKDKQIETYNKNLTEKTKKLEMASEEFKSSQIDLDSQIETLKDNHKKLEKDLKGKEFELIRAKQQCESLQSSIVQQNEELKKLHKRMSNDDNASKVLKLTKANENYKLNLTQKDLELKKCQERLKETSTTQELQKHELIEANKTIESMKADLARKDKEIETYNKKLERMSKDSASKMSTLTKENEDYKSVIAQKDSELKKYQERMSNDDNASKILKLTKTSENYKLTLTQKDLELKRCQERLKETSTKQELQNHELIKANRTVESMRADLAQKEKQIETYNKNLTEKTKKLKKDSEEFKLSQRDLESQIEALKDHHKKLENDLKGKELELIKAKQQCESLQSNIVQQNEERKNLHKRREKSMSPPSKQNENEEQNFKKYENFPKKSLVEKLVDTERDLKKCQESLLKYEEKSFKFTNAFTSAGEGSVLDMSKRYRHIQHNKRAAAARAIKKVNKIDAREHLCGQIMCAYETAKSLVLDEARNCIKNNLYELQKDDRTPRNQELLQGCMMVLSCIEEDERIKKTAINQIHEKLIPDGMQLPPEVEDYYQSLAELTWCAVARPIPMIIAKSPDTYCKMCHELKDGEDVEDGRAVSYVYPVLYSSNEWPRQVAQEGRVVLKT